MVTTCTFKFSNFVVAYLCDCSVVTSVAFHPESQCLASGSADKTLKMWDIRSHLLIQHYPAHEDEITSISMHSVSLSANTRF